ncbi:MAG: PAS domain S-box protein [Pirellulaceae bacterium]
MAQKLRGEPALRDSDRWLQAIFDQAAVGVAQVENATGRYVRINRRYCQIVGRTAAEMPSIDFMAITHPDDVAVDLEYSRKLRTGEIAEFAREKRYLRPDGSVIWVKLSVTPMWQPGQPPDYQIAVVEDITQHKQAEDELRASEERLRLALDAGGMGLWQWDIKRDCIRWNRREYELLGLPIGNGEVAADLFFQMVHPDDRAGFQAQVDRSLATGADLGAEMRVIRADGQVRWFVGQGRVYRDPAGEPAQMVGVNYDITERKQAEDKLRASEQMLQTVIDNIPQGVFWKDRDSVYLGCNRVILQSRGMDSVEQIVGKTDRQLAGLSADEAEYFVATDREVILGNRPQLGIVEPMTRADGTTVWLETSKLPLHDQAGRVIGLLGTWQDITQRLQLEEQLRQSQKMEAVGSLAGGVAHDFNNLLTVILGYSEMLLSSLPPGSDALHAQVVAISEAGERAAALTRQLLAFSRKQVLEPKVLDLNGAVSGTEKMLRRLIGEDIVLTAELEPDLSPVRVDPIQIEQVIINLAVNARDAMPAGGRMTIRTTRCELLRRSGEPGEEIPPGRYVRLSVTDTGSGMSPEVQARIFEPFFTTKELGKGTGLGLATVYGIVKQSGGRVTVASELGVGTTFHVLLPAVEPAPLAALHGETPPPRGGLETVLLVEDEPAVRKLAKGALVRRGYRVLEAGHGREALAVAEAHDGPIDMLITDVVMPEMSGRQLVDHLVPLRPGIKVLLVSGYTEDAVVRHGIADRANHFLPKPFTLAALAAKVREVLDG